MFVGFVLNLTIAMKWKRMILLGLWVILAWGASGFQDVPGSGILTPAAGDAVRGVVSIVGTTDTPGFSSAEISFGYMSDATQTWFLLGQSFKIVVNDFLVSWDTTSIPDGNYRLRLRVFLTGGQVMEYFVDGIRVRNYSAIETSTPEVVETGVATPRPQPTATIALKPTLEPKTATPLPQNSAVVTWDDLNTSIKTGVLAATGIFILAGLYLAARAANRRR